MLYFILFLNFLTIYTRAEHMENLKNKTSDATDRTVSDDLKSLAFHNGSKSELRNYFHKCCQFGSIMLGKNCSYSPEEDLLFHSGLNLSYHYQFKRHHDFKKSSHFNFLYGRPCSLVYIETQPWRLQEDGSLYVDMPNTIPPWQIRGPETYCIDTFVHQGPDGNMITSLDALVCFAENEEHYYLVSSTCMLISCVFILATCAVYAWLPELRNLHGRVLMAYLICLFIGFAFLASMQIRLVTNNISSTDCVVTTFIAYFFLLSAFFWLNVMSFDIWWTFSGKRGMSLNKLSTRGRFYAYAAYAFSIPTALTILLAALEFSDLPPHPFLPMLRHQGCFLFGTSKLIYLYGPIVVLCVANMIFFVLTAVKIAQIKQQTSVLKSKESSTHDQHRKDKQRLLLYVKLFAVMGINWILEVISAVYPQVQGLWRITDAYNVLVGLIIFIIFVCKRKMFILIKKRMKERFQKNRSDLGDTRSFGNKNRQLSMSKMGQRGSAQTIKSTIYIDSDGSIKTSTSTNTSKL